MVIGTFRKVGIPALIALALCAYAAVAPAQLNTNANIRATKHNLSASGTGTTKASSEDQICVFCHTPHAANAVAPSPLWNRTLSSATYTPYTSNSLDAEKIFGALSQPGGSSKLCLSCHDGTMALGTVGVLDGKTNQTIAMSGGTTTMPTGAGATTGFTRNLGTDLRNDHPISFTFDGTLAARDGEFRTPPYSSGGSPVVSIRSSGVKPMLPLDHEGKVQCTSCHDPHLQASKFLRLNRFQQNASAGTTFNPANDQICLGCHDKNKDSQGNAYLAWSNSAHANSSLSAYTYTAAASTQREFPANIPVWQAGCLNCHDTHTVQGSRRLLREGTDNTSAPKAGGNPAIEETCYQCHSNAPIIANTTLTATSGVPDIKTEFGSTRKRMPIASTDQPAGAERHDIGGNFTDPTFVDCSGTSNKCGADFIEQRSVLGANNHTSRHVECTDCHNPHRVIKNALFNGQGSATRRTHVPGGVNGNVASGALRGTFGVQPVYPALSTASNWPETPSTYDVKRGDPGANTNIARSNTYVTREYQLCLKCHSDYGAGTAMPSLSSYTGGTASGTNGITRYTNVAAEFAVSATDPPSSGGDQGEQGNAGTACGGDCDPAGNSPQAGGATGNNHRSWHPVMWPTGRDAKERTKSSSGTFDNIRNPYITNLGTQTMYCSDCHGHSASWTQGATQGAVDNGPNLAAVQGPHGSDQNFILKGKWDTTVTPSSTRTGNSSGGICGRCHNPTDNSGFDGADSEASHGWSAKSSRYCMACHIAVPHGWKNKAFLVNLACVGPEGGKPDGCTSVGSTSTETIAPYYNQALLRINTWQASGQWTETSCGVSGNNGKDWMSSACGF
jgi:hypothetical protein